VIEGIYGRPPRRVEKSKGPAPYLVYDFPEPGCQLDIAYDDDIAVWAGWKTGGYIQNDVIQIPDARWYSEQEKLMHSKIKSLKAVRDLFWKAISSARWNKR
jgi:hypothetical protein